MRNVSDTSRDTAKAAPPDLLPPFEVHVESGPKAVCTVLKHIFDGLAGLELDIEESNTVELVLAEALNNVVEHAYPEPDQPGAIHITAQHQQDGVHFQICDWGRPMPDCVAPIGKLVPCDGDVKDLPEGGFGWFLIKDLAKDVIYKRVYNENRLSLRIAVGYQLGS